MEVLWPYSLLVAQYKCTNLMMETTWIIFYHSIWKVSYCSCLQTIKPIRNLYESVQFFCVYTHIPQPTTSYRNSILWCFLHFLSDIIRSTCTNQTGLMLCSTREILSILILSCQEGALSGSTVIHPEVLKMIHDGNLTLMEEILHQLRER